MPDDPAGPAAGPIRHDEHAEGGAFVLERDGERLAELTYSLDADGSAVLEHTYVSDTLRGQGVALQLTQSAVDWARGANVKVVPVCSYVRAAFARHHELRDVLRP